MPGVLHQVSKSPARLNEGINSRRNSGLWYQCRKQKWYESINEEKKRHQTYVKREKEIKHETTTSDSNSISNSLRIQMYSGQKKYDVYSIGNFAKDTNNTVHYLLSTLCCAVLGCSGVPNSLQPHGLQPARLLCPWDSLARILEWVAMPSSGGSSQPRDRTQVSHTAGRFFTDWATREALSTLQGEFL